MTDQTVKLLQSQITRLKATNKKLREENAQLKQHNAKLINCVDRYHAFMGVHNESVGQ